MPTKVLLSGALVLLLCSAQRSAAQSQMAPDPRFGLVESFWLPEEAADLGVGWDRILFYWRDIQPHGPDEWNTLHVREEWLAQANASGRTAVGLLKNTAPWASEDGTDAGLPKGLYLPDDDPGNLWANFARRVAEYYGVRNVHHWIVWNEPEILPGVYGYEFAGSLDDYYQLVKVAYRVMKEADPQAVIHLAGVTWWHDEDYLERLFRLAVEDPEASANDYFFDVVSLHIYFRAETVATITRTVYELQQRYGLDKPIWINETNAPPDRDPLWPVRRPDFPIDAQQQAWFVLQAFALGFASGAERVAVYKLVDIHLPDGGESYGLLRPDGSRRPSYDAYHTATDYLSGFTAAYHQPEALYHLVHFERPQGSSRVIWARGPSEVALSVPALADSAVLVRGAGDVQPIAPDEGQYEITLEGARCTPECLVGGPPVIIVEDLPDPVSLAAGRPAVGSLPTPIDGAAAPPVAAAGTAEPTVAPEQQRSPPATQTPVMAAVPAPSTASTQGVGPDQATVADEIGHGTRLPVAFTSATALILAGALALALLVFLVSRRFQG
jgi:hypothetical protein